MVGLLLNVIFGSARDLQITLREINEILAVIGNATGYYAALLLKN